MTFIVNGTGKDIVVQRSKFYTVPAHSIVSTDVLVNALGTNHADIDASLQAQYPKLTLVDAGKVITVATEEDNPHWSDEWGEEGDYVGA